MQRIPCPNLGIKWVIFENSIQSILCDASMRIQPFCPDTVMKGTISISSHLHVQCHRAYSVFVCLCRSNVKASSLVCSSPVWRVLNNFGDNLSQQMHAWCHGRSSVESSTFSLTARFSRQIHTWITRKQQTHSNSLHSHYTLSIGFSRLVVLYFSMWAGVMFIDSYMQCSFWSCFCSRLTTLPRKGKAAWWRCQCPTKVVTHKTTQTNSIELVGKHSEQIIGDDSSTTTRNNNRHSHSTWFKELHTELPKLFLPTTPWKFNIAPEKWWLEDYFPIGKATFQGLC